MIGTVTITFADRNIDFPWQEMNIVEMMWKCYFFKHFKMWARERKKKECNGRKKKRKENDYPQNVSVFPCNVCNVLWKLGD